MRNDLTRRELLQAAAVAVASGVSPLRAVANPAANSTSGDGRSGERKRVLRLAHLTDSHVQPELRAGEGLAACFRHALGHQDKPELIVTGGDLVMDAFESDASRTKLQWELFLRILKDECPIPIEHCLGNHDIWGWNKAKSGTTGAEPNYGKKWAQEVLGLASPYYATDRAGWRFIVLDSVHPDGERYRGELDGEQFDWFKKQLARTPRDMPIVVVSHIPILSATVFTGIRNSDDNREAWRVPASVMHMDARRILALFDEHPNVKLCLSGHIHLLDRVQFNGVTYICDGAVSGAWWKGPNQRCKEGYGIIDLYADGSFEHAYQAYEWNPAG